MFNSDWPAGPKFRKALTLDLHGKFDGAQIVILTQSGASVIPGPANESAAAKSAMAAIE